MGGITAAMNKILSREMFISLSLVAFYVPKSTPHDKATSIKCNNETLLENKIGKCNLCPKAPQNVGSKIMSVKSPQLNVKKT